MRSLFFVLTAFFASVLPAAMAQGFQGTWYSKEGTISLWEEYKGSGKQNQVYGTFGKNGYIVGRSNGKTLRGVYAYANQATGKIIKNNGDSFGTFEWNLTSDFKQFNGPKRTGKALPNGSPDSWSGRFVSTQPPKFDRSKLRRYSAGFLIEVGPAVNKWMNAVSTLDGAGYLKKPDDMLGDFKISVVGALSAEEQAAVNAFVNRNRGLKGYNCYFYKSDESGLRCEIPASAGKTISTFAGGKIVGTDGYDVPKTDYLDATQCVPGTVRVDGYFLVCDYAGWSGSYAQTCDKLELQGAARRRDSRLVSYCEGPEQRIGLSMDYRTLFNKLGKNVVYYKYPDASQHASASDRYYKSELDPDKYDCPSKKLWNNNGYLNCSK